MQINKKLKTYVCVFEFVCVCVFQYQPTAVLYASVSALCG